MQDEFTKISIFWIRSAFMFTGLATHNNSSRNFLIGLLEAHVRLQFGFGSSDNEDGGFDSRSGRGFFLHGKNKMSTLD